MGRDDVASRGNVDKRLRHTHGTPRNSVIRPLARPVLILLRMATVADIIALKGSTAHRVGPHDTVYTAIERMVKHNIGALVVIENDALVGVITERDYLRRI